MSAELKVIFCEIDKLKSKIERLDENGNDNQNKNEIEAF